jgi:hypothetical protein
MKKMLLPLLLIKVFMPLQASDALEYWLSDDIDANKHLTMPEIIANITNNNQKYPTASQKECGIYLAYVTKCRQQLFDAIDTSESHAFQVLGQIEMAKPESVKLRPEFIEHDLHSFDYFQYRKNTRKSPLVSAVIKGHLGLAHALIDRGICHPTALEEAVKKRFLCIIKKLAPKVAAQDKSNWHIPFAVAIADGTDGTDGSQQLTEQEKLSPEEKRTIIPMLLEGFDVENTRNTFGSTVFCCSALWGSTTATEAISSLVTNRKMIEDKRDYLKALVKQHPTPTGSKNIEWSRIVHTKIDILDKRLAQLQDQK